MVGGGSGGGSGLPPFRHYHSTTTTTLPPLPPYRHCHSTVTTTLPPLPLYQEDGRQPGQGRDRIPVSNAFKGGATRFVQHRVSILVPLVMVVAAAAVSGGCFISDSGRSSSRGRGRAGDSGRMAWRMVVIYE